MSSNAPLNGEIIPPGTLPQPAQPKPKSIEQCVTEDLGEEIAQKAFAILDELGTKTESMESICGRVLGKDGNAAFCQFHGWRRKSAALATMYTHARESRADVMIDEIVALADAPFDNLTSKDPHAVRAEVEARKLKIESRKWVAGKFNRGLYGDEPQRPGVSVTINNDGGAAALAEIRRRLARKRQAMLANSELERSDRAGLAGQSLPTPREPTDLPNGSNGPA